MRRSTLTVLIVCSVTSALSCGARTGGLGDFEVSVVAGDGGGDALTRDAGAPLDSAAHDSEPPGRDASPACGIVRSRVFLTSTLHDGDLGGVAGADAECAALANAQKLGGSWRAWLSDSHAPASARISAAPGGYVLLDGTVVASTFDVLVSGSLEHPIDLTELGRPIQDSNTEVWTGIDLTGPSDSNGYCSDAEGNDWSSRDRSAPFPFVGHSNARDVTWTAAYLQFCNRTNVRLYCFEVCG